MANWPTWDQKKKLFELMGYAPHSAQLPAHKSTAGLLVIAGGERAGKSEYTGREIIARIPWCAVQAGGAGRVAVVAQEYDECHAEMNYIAAGLEALGGLASKSFPKSGKWICSTWEGTTVETISLQDGPEELTGTGDAFDIVALVEAGLIREGALGAALGRTSETDGLILVSGTLKDTYGWHADLFRDCLAGPAHNTYSGAAFSMPTWCNLAKFPGGELDPKILHLKATLTDDEYNRRVAALLVPSPARMFPEFDRAVHVRKVAYDDTLPVELAVDAGYYPSRYAVLALQVVQQPVKFPDGSVAEMEVVRQIGELWEHHRTHHDIYEMCQAQPWWDRVTRVVLGHEGKQHQAAESTQEVWRNLARAEGLSLRVVVFNAGRVLDGIVRVKTILKDPATGVSRFTQDVTCTGLAHEWQAYKRKTDAKGNVTSDEPADKDNDAIDALRNWMVDRYGYVERVRKPSVKGRAPAKMRG